MTTSRTSTSRVTICAIFGLHFTAAFVPSSSVLTTRRQYWYQSAPLAAYLDVELEEPAAKLPKPVDTVSLGTLTVPQVGVGTISWSADKASDRYELERLMETAAQHPSGLLLDTAERYGSNIKTAFGLGWGETERLTGKLLSTGSSSSSSNNHDPEKTIVATKFTPSPWRTTVQSVVEACQDSRQRLMVDGGSSTNADQQQQQPIDLYQLHMPDIVQPMAKLGRAAAPKDTIYWDGLAECYHRGLVKNVGVCNYGPTLLMQCQEHLAKKGVPLASNQIGYSVLGRHNGAQATLEKGKELGIQTLAFFPFAMGLLTGKYNHQSINNNNLLESRSTSSSSLRSSKRSRLEEYDLYRYALGDGDSIPKGGISKLLQAMQEIADAHDATLAQVALNFVICQGGIPIPGARTEEQYLDNMGSMGWRMNASELARLEEESDKLGFGFEGAGFKRTSEKFVGYGVEKWTLN
ncbi:Potassium voltage-gated channel, shaker-related subfamily, beta member [Seminavis robusta]|uniref:Potassium voltage-gated channel, shaker-related subfamily, beta member n=1 Tax=Seminavis robusta TaxID=568900 RepID=A0A9N8H5H1_9STRA|nr:Potassium voltage-gated channel, shaker-related subfamily, beta member [Seminavis robusta]|eukprot:Sro74_g040780.1 Potassium voltage-gated channel, shaker-related subfamily, beta member (464) ;mRNA; f:65166-66669